MQDVCYVCGHQALTGLVYCRSDSKRKDKPFFQFLLTLTAAPGAQPVSVDGSVHLCNLCSNILLEQWKCFEKRSVPQAGRQYWLKTYCPNDPVSASPQLSTNGSDNCDSPSPALTDVKCNLCAKIITSDEPAHRIPNQALNRSNAKEITSNVEVILCNVCYSKDANLQKCLSDLAQSHVISSMASRSSNHMDATRQQLVSLYENLMMKFHLTGMVDPTLLGQLQQLSAAEALASLQSTPRVSVVEQNENQPRSQPTSTFLSFTKMEK